jgi:hypothetical protein
MKIFLLFTFAAFIQLCPAPFIPAIIAGASEAVEGIVEGSLVGEAAGDIGGSVSGEVGAARKRDKEYRSSQPTTESLKACWIKALKAAPQVVVHNESSITLTGLHSCWTDAINGAM